MGFFTLADFDILRKHFWWAQFCSAFKRHRFFVKRKICFSTGKTTLFCRPSDHHKIQVHPKFNVLKFSVFLSQTFRGIKTKDESQIATMLFFQGCQTTSKSILKCFSGLEDLLEVKFGHSDLLFILKLVVISRSPSATVAKLLPD